MSRNSRTRYRNSLGVPWVGFLVANGLVVLAFGCAYVYLANQRHRDEEKRQGLAQETAALRGETERLQVRAIALRTAESLRQLSAASSLDLVEIAAGDVVLLEPPPDPPGAAAGTDR
jgi:hypothetical protein